MVQNMAKIFLQPDDNHYKIGNSNTLAYGSSLNQNQSVELTDDIFNVILDANVDGLKLPTRYLDYQFLQMGNALKILKSDTVVAQINIQDDIDGSEIAFSDKTTTAKFEVNKSGVAITLDSVIVSATSSDKTSPQLTVFSPKDDSIDVAVNSNLTLTFNEAIKTGSGSIILNGSDTRVIDINDKNQISISGNTLTINPTLDLKSNDFYSVQLSSGVIKDLAGNAFAGITDNTLFNFRTESVKLTAGKAIDGYLSGAMVFADANEDGIWNEGEAKATTDGNGNFVLTGAKGSIVASGGIDLSTGKEFKGVLKAPEGSTVVTPLTTIQQGFVEQGKTAEEAHLEVSKLLGIDATAVNLTTYDPIAELAKTDSSANETNKTLAIQLMASTLQVANFLVTAGQTLQGAAGEANLSAHDASAAVVKSLVSTLQKNTAEEKTSKLDLSDSSFLKSVLVGSAKEVLNTLDNEKSKQIDVSKLTEKVEKVADSAVSLMTESALNINSIIEKGGNASDLLNDLSKVSDFAQNQVGVALKQITSTTDSTNTNIKEALSEILKEFKQKEEPPTGLPQSPNLTATPPSQQTTESNSGGGSSNTNTGGSSSSSSPAAPTFTVNVANGIVSWDGTTQGKVITFGGTATGNITMSVNANNVATFSRGGVSATTTVSDLYNTTIKNSILLNNGENLELSPAQATAFSLNNIDYQLVRSNGGKTIINTATFTENTKLYGLSTPIEFHENGVNQTTVNVNQNVTLSLGWFGQIDGFTFVGAGNVSTYRGVGDGNHNYTILTTGRNNMNSGQDADVITTGNGENEITGQQNADLITLSVNGGTDTLIYRFSGTSYTPNNLSDSTTATFDTVKNFQVGTDKIWLALEGHNGTELVPESLTRFADVDGSSITSQNLLVSNVLKSQAFSNLPAKAAGIIVVNGGDFAGTYLYVNNSNAALQENDDLFIKFENIQNLGNVGTLTPLSYFRDYFPSNGGNNNSSGSNSNNNNAPAMQSIYTRDTNANGVLDAGDEIEFIFTEVVKASLLMNQNGSIVTNPVSQSGELVIMADGGATLGANPTIRANGLSNGYSGSYTITLGAGTTMAAGGKIKANLGHVEDIDGNHPTNNIEFILPALNGSSSNNSNVAEDTLTEAARQQALADEAARQQALADEAARQQALADEAARQQALADEAAKQQALAETYSIQRFITSLNANTITATDTIRIEDTPTAIQSGLSTLIANISLIDSIRDTWHSGTDGIRDAWYSDCVSLTKEQYQLLKNVLEEGDTPVIIVAKNNDDFTDIDNNFGRPSFISFSSDFSYYSLIDAYKIAIPDGTDLKLTSRQANEYSYTYNQSGHNLLGDLTNAGNITVVIADNSDDPTVIGLGNGDILEVYGFAVVTPEYHKLVRAMTDNVELRIFSPISVNMTTNPDVKRYDFQSYSDHEITLASSFQNLTFSDHYKNDYKNIVNTGNLTEFSGFLMGVDLINVNNSITMNGSIYGIYNNPFATSLGTAALGTTIQLSPGVEVIFSKDIDLGNRYDNYLYLIGSSNSSSYESVVFNGSIPANLNTSNIEIVEMFNPFKLDQLGQQHPITLYNGAHSNVLIYNYTEQFYTYDDDRRVDSRKFNTRIIEGFSQSKDRIVISDTLTQDFLHYSFNIGDAGAADTFTGAANFINANIDDFFWFGEDLEVGQDMYLAIADNDSWAVFRYLASTNYNYHYDSATGQNVIDDPIVKPSELSLVVRVEGALNEAGVFPVDVGIDYHAPKQEDFIGTDGNDNLIGNEVDNYIEGGAGNDTLQGLEGDDILVGSYDQDDIDTAVYSGVSTDYLVEKQLDPDWQKPFYFVTDLNPDNGDEGWDMLYSIENLQFSDKTVSVEQAVSGSASSVDDIFGTDGDDNLIGNNLDNYIDGGYDGNDTLTGLEGDDILIGDSGIDTAVYRGNMADYTIEEYADEDAWEIFWVVTDNNTADGDDGMDTLYSIEFLQFANVAQHELPVTDLFSFFGV